MGKYVVYDLEMCRVPTKEARDAFGSRQELIQIGAVLLDESYEITDSFITYVKPRYGQIDSFIEKLTGIKPSDVIDAPSTEDALDSFLRWIPDDATMVSWSMSDPGQLYHEIDGKGIDLPRLEDLLDESIDCQYEFEEKIEATRPYGLSKALSITGIDCDENIHDALTDASNTALLFRKIMEEPVLSMSKYYLSENDMSEYMHNAGFGLI